MLRLSPTATEQWQDLVREAARGSRRTLGPEVEGYVVRLLVRVASRPELVPRVPPASLGRHGDEGNQRTDRLKDVGDQCLLFAGLFPDQATRRQLPMGYFVNLGCSAYQLLGGTPGRRGAVYRALARRFAAVIDVLRALRTLVPQRGLPDPLDAYELWDGTGSPGARRLLLESRRVRDAQPDPGPLRDEPAASPRRRA